MKERIVIFKVLTRAKARLISWWTGVDKMCERQFLVWPLKSDQRVIKKKHHVKAICWTGWQPFSFKPNLHTIV